jgi:hypothetical protein
LRQLNKTSKKAPMAQTRESTVRSLIKYAGMPVKEANDFVDALALLSSTQLAFGNSLVGSDTTDKYLTPLVVNTAAGIVQLSTVAPRAGFLYSLEMIHGVPAGNGADVVYTAEINASPTALTATLASTTAQVKTFSDYIAVAQGDLISILVEKAGSIATSPSAVSALVGFA